MYQLELHSVLSVAALLFCIGLYGVLTRRNSIAMLMGLELMFNAVNINLVAFAHFLPHLDGIILAMFGLAVAAAESAIGIAIILSIYRNFRHIDTDGINELKG
ncbi:NADH-quinone oxidoreductase subunit NuoK [bacterium]|nr:NADH-quinone oxidoreductase subunit NuoK [bacterium]